MNTLKLPRISETEWEVMRAVWSGHPCMAHEVIRRLQAADPDWHPRTVKTLLARLVKKRALAHRSEGRAYVYRPTVARAACEAATVQLVVDRIFGGSLPALLACWVAQQKPSAAELKQLRKVLRKLEA